MRTLLAFVVVFSMLCSTYAQAEDSLIIMGFDVKEILGQITTGLKGVGLVPDLQGFDDASTKAFFIILILMWMVFSIAIGLDDLPAAIFSFFITSVLFNKLPALFVTDTTIGLFIHAFSALFIFIWVDYILHYMWGISSTTKLFLDASITMVAVMFLNFTNVFTIIEGWITLMLSWVGFFMFILFMLGMRVFNTYFSLMNIKSAKDIRSEGRKKADQAKSDADKFIESKRK